MNDIAKAVFDESEACRISAAQNGSPTAEIFHVMHVGLASLAKRLEPKDNEPVAGPGTYQTFCSHCNAQVDSVPYDAPVFTCPHCAAVCVAPAVPKAMPQEVGGTHYQEGVKCSPWSLQKEMASSGNAFVDARRADAIKYTFRMKSDLPKLVEGMTKAKHCLEAGIAELQRHINSLPKA